jgi:preprotein translocase subunit SecA
VEVSEVLSKMLQRQKINHNVLNAKQHQREAEIVTEAGHKGAVTIATNMAGRGTDIKLTAEVKAAGGLAIIGTERHDARRIDRQLRGRAGRQGDPGSSQFFISLEDDLMRLFGGDRIANIMQKMKVPEGEPIQHSMVTSSVTNAQKKVEENNFGVRKRLIEYDNVMNQQRTAIYDLRRHALFGERLKGEILDYVANLADEWFDTYHAEGNLEALKNQVRTLLLCEIEISDKDFPSMKKEHCTEIIMEAASEFYHRKEEKLGIDLIRALEKFAFLQTIDDKWKEHLMVMDELKEGIHLRAYGQKDPLLEYKGEAVNLFRQLVAMIQKETVHKAFSLFPQVMQAPPQQQQQRRSVPSMRSTPRMPQRQKPPAGTNDALPDPSVVTVTQSPSFRFSQPSVSTNIKNKPPGSTE